MISIRNRQFETNSSSVHVLVIPKDTNIHIPKVVSLTGGEYGWENEEYWDTLNYFYQACVDAGRESVAQFFAYLKEKGVEEIHAPELHWVKSQYGDYEYAENNDGGIDHSGEIPLQDMFANESLLDRFLFGDSFVVTGNDNSDECPDEDDYDEDQYDTILKYN